MRSTPWHRLGGPFGLSLLLHAALLVLMLIGFAGARVERPRPEAEIVQAHIVEEQAAEPGKGRERGAEPRSPVPPPSVADASRNEAGDAGAAPRSSPEDPQRQASEETARRQAQLEHDRALQELRQRQQIEERRAAEWKARDRAKQQSRLEAERRAERQKAAAEAKAVAEAQARVQADAVAQQARLQAEARRRAEDQAAEEQAARARADADKLARARAEAEAKRKADQAAKVAAENAAKAKAEREAKAKADQEARMRAEAEKAARAKAEAEAKARADQEAEAKVAAKRKAEQERLAQAEREKSLKQQLDAEQQEAEFKLRIEDAARRWLNSRIEPRVEGRWLRPLSAQGGMTCIIAIRTTATGQVIGATVTKSSGDEAFDRSAEAAVRKASPLPMPPDPKVAEQFLSFSLRFKP